MKVLAHDILASMDQAVITTKSDGAGMGLAWSQKIVEQHQGHIDFESQPGSTVFNVSIPVSLAREL